MLVMVGDSIKVMIHTKPLFRGYPQRISYAPYNSQVLSSLSIYCLMRGQVRITQLDGGQIICWVCNISYNLIWSIICTY